MKVKLAKKEVIKALKTSATKEEAATKLGVNRRTLYTRRVELGLVTPR